MFRGAPYFGLHQDQEMIIWFSPLGSALYLEISLQVSKEQEKY
jgi:hypothetical protein